MVAKVIGSARTFAGGGVGLFGLLVMASSFRETSGRPHVVSGGQVVTVAVIRESYRVITGITTCIESSRSIEKT
jgi:hypothetical protein